MAISRRRLLKLALMAGASGAILPCLSYKEAKALVSSAVLKGCEKHVTGCMWCQCGCSMMVYVKGNRAVHVTGNPDDPLTRGMICMKPLGSLELLRSNYRLKRPLKRVAGRGDDAKLVEIDWDEALDEIAHRLMEIKKRCGGQALGVWASGRSALDARYLSKALCRLFGTRNWEKTGPFCNYSGKIGTETVVGTRNTPWIYTDDDFFSARDYVLLGSNMAATKPVVFRRLRMLQEAGRCSITVIDPRRSETAEAANWHLAIRPGTDLALGLALGRFLVERNLTDRDFLENHSVGFEKYKKFLLDGPFTLKWAERITGIPEGEMERLGLLLARSKRLIMVANAGISHHVNAAHTHRTFSLLAAMTGRYGRKGNGYACLNNGAFKIGSLPLPKGKIPKAKRELGKNPVMWLESLEDPSYPYKLRALISTGTPAVQWPEQRRLRRLIGKLDLSVINEIVPNTGARYFDFMLPAAFWIEAGGLSPVSDESRFVWCPKLVDAPGEARPDRWWWVELGKRLGFGDVFTDSLKDPVFLQDLCGKRGGYTVRNFTSKKDNGLRAPITIKNGKIRERTSLFLDKKFPTSSGKVEFWTRSVEKMFSSLGLSLFPGFYSDKALSTLGIKTVEFSKRPVPCPFQKGKTFMFKTELKKEDGKDASYPLILTTGKPSEAIMGHTCHWVKVLHRHALCQECWIHPETAQKARIQKEQRIKIESPKGSCLAMAKITRHIRRDTIFIPSTFGKGIPFMKKDCDFKTVNFLTDMDSRCPVSGQIAYKAIRARIGPAS